MNSRVTQFAAYIPHQAGQPEKLAASSSSIDEKHRRLIVHLIFVVYALLILEGAIRKWVAPHLGKPLFFIRDPFVLAIYILVFTKRTRLRNGFLEIGCLLGFAGFVIAVAQRIAGPQDFLSIVLSAYG